jgi:K+ transporter
VIANAAFLAAMVLLLIAFVLLDQLEFLAAYRRVIVGAYLWPILGGLLLLFLNLFGWIYLAGKRLFLKETGQKLAHVEKLLYTEHTVVRDLSTRLAREE